MSVMDRCISIHYAKGTYQSTCHFLGLNLPPLVSVTAGLYPHWNVTHRSRYVCLHNTHVLWSITDTCLYEAFQVTHPLISVRCYKG